VTLNSTNFSMSVPSMMMLGTKGSLMLSRICKCVVYAITERVEEIRNRRTLRVRDSELLPVKMMHFDQPPIHAPGDRSVTKEIPVYAP